MAEVSRPVIAIVLVLNAVFLPVAFLGGLVGEMYRQFAITIAVSVTISGFVALTLTPAMCAKLLQTGEVEPSGPARALRCRVPEAHARLHVRRALDDAARVRRGGGDASDGRGDRVARALGAERARAERGPRLRARARRVAAGGVDAAHEGGARCSSTRPRSRIRRSSTTSRSRASTCRRAASAATPA